MIARPITLALVALVALAALFVAPARAQSEDREKAAAYFRQGQAYFQRGDYDRALAEYKAAYQLSKEPTLIFNIGLCHARANRPEEALLAFQRYLELDPNGDVADETREEVARLMPAVEKIREERAKEEAARRERERNRPRVLAPASPVPLYIAAGGAAIGAAGAVFHLLSLRTRDKVAEPQDYDSYLERVDSFKLQRNIAIAGYVTGALTIVTAGILRITVFRRRELEVAPAVSPGGAGVAVRWWR